MNEERTVLWLRQTENIRGHLRQRYSVTVNQVMVMTVKLDDVNIPTRNHGFSSFIVFSKEITIGTTSSEISYQQSTERNILHIQVLLECCYICTYKWIVHNGTNWNHLMCGKVSFLSGPHCQFRGVGQGMKKT